MLAGRDGVGVDLDRVGAVFEVVLLGHRGAGKLARLADRDEADTERVGHGGTKDEPSSFDADDSVDSGVMPRIGERLDGRRKPLRMGEQGRDVLEDDPGLGNVGDVADQAGEFGDGQSSHYPIVAGSGLLLFPRLRRLTGSSGRLCAFRRRSRCAAWPRKDADCSRCDSRCCSAARGSSGYRRGRHRPRSPVGCRSRLRADLVGDCPVFGFALFHVRHDGRSNEDRRVGADKDADQQGDGELLQRQRPEEDRADQQHRQHRSTDVIEVLIERINTWLSDWFIISL